jgi:hypothetical protein
MGIGWVDVALIDGAGCRVEPAAWHGNGKRHERVPHPMMEETDLARYAEIA